MITLLLASLYLISCFFVRRYLKIAYSKVGRWSNLKPEYEDLFFTLFPLINTIAVLCLWVAGSPYRNNIINPGQKFLNKFFGL